MIRSGPAIAAALIAASISFLQPVFAEEETDQRFGTVHFDTSCNDITQQRSTVQGLVVEKKYQAVSPLSQGVCPK